MFLYYNVVWQQANQRREHSAVGIAEAESKAQDAADHADNGVAEVYAVESRPDGVRQRKIRGFRARHDSARRIDQLRNEGDVDGLIGMLDNADASARVAAATALGEMGLTSAVEPLVRALNVRGLSLADASQVRGAVTTALERIGQPAVEPLLSALGAQNPDVRGQAARALAAIGQAGVLGESAVTALISAPDHPESCEPAATALGLIGDRRAVEPLIHALRSGRGGEAAVEALCRIDDPRARRVLAAHHVPKRSSPDRFG